MKIFKYAENTKKRYLKILFKSITQGKLSGLLQFVLFILFIGF